MDPLSPFAPCPACSQPLTGGDAIVTCAGCGAQSHERCFRTLGRCACGSGVARSVASAIAWRRRAWAVAREHGSLVLFIALGLAALELLRRFLARL
ncbi:MAG: hypothetical protein HYY84_18595 [Deltaproteobacteria bacterium]|nr:hypothetical protein [Deltaproteobacteria bacterium]